MLQIYLYQYWTMAKTQKNTCVDLIITNIIIIMYIHSISFCLNVTSKVWIHVYASCICTEHILNNISNIQTYSKELFVNIFATKNVCLSFLGKDIKTTMSNV